MLYKIKQQETSRYVCFNQYSIHLQIETYLIPFRKLRNFYEKVTDFLKDDSVSLCINIHQLWTNSTNIEKVMNRRNDS